MDSAKSVALLCSGLLATCLPRELDRLAGLSDLRGDLTLVKSALCDFAAETVRSAVLLRATRVRDSAGFEAVSSLPTFRTCFASRALLSLIGCFLGDTLVVLLVLTGGFAAVRCVSVLGGRLDAGRISLADLAVTFCGCDDA